MIIADECLLSGILCAHARIVSVQAEIGLLGTFLRRLISRFFAELR